MKTLFLSLIFFAASAHAFHEEKVTFPVGDGINLQGYIASPDAAGIHPAFVMQMGSGQGTTDSDKRKYNPFAALARHLADEGYVVLRFDKRGTGYNATNGSFADGTFSDYVADLKAAVRAMQKRQDVLSGQIFLYGHSLGGPVVSIVASAFPEVKGIILSASPGRSFSGFNSEQTRYLLQWGELLSGNALEKAVADTKRESDLIRSPSDFCREFPLDCNIEGEKTYMWGQSAKFWQEIADLDPISLLRQVHCPVFAIYGTSDWVISSTNDGGPVEMALPQNTKSSVLVLDGLDHFLTEVGSKQTSVEAFWKASHGEPYDPQVHPGYFSAIDLALKNWTK